MPANISYSGGNARLAYSLKGAHVAKLRCSKLAISYGVVSDESHAKHDRALYPHQRVQGTFSLTFDFIHWRETNQAMAWFREYILAVTEQRNPSYMQVQLDARQFLRLGYPTTGIVFGDHKGSMVFSPTITFISVADPRDSTSGINTLNKAISGVTLPPANSLSTKWFYPTSVLNSPGKLQSYLFDQTQLGSATSAARAQDAIEGSGNSTAGDAPERATSTGGGVGQQRGI